MSASLEHPLPILRAGLDDVRLELFISLPDDHGLSDGDDVVVRVAYPDQAGRRRDVVLASRVTHVEQDGAGSLVGLSPMVVRLKVSRVSVE
jgi:hypothetical protein